LPDHEPSALFRDGWGEFRQLRETGVQTCPSPQSSPLSSPVTEDAEGATPNDASTARLRRLLREYFDFVWRTLRRLGLDDAEAEDASQEVFWIAARRLASIQEQHERSYLFGTALRVAGTHRRSRRRRAEVIQPTLDDQRSLAPDPEERRQWMEARALLGEILDGMDLDLRAVFVLFELEELSGPVIAELLGIPIGTVNSRLRRARAAFRAAVRRSETPTLRRST
jgi:RNA polymerase sigma-70 factor (ECF subfamily)